MILINVIFFCLHDFAQQNTNIKTILSNDIHELIKKPIRITFNTSLINSTIDSKMCKYSGENISWFLFNNPFLCQESDIITNKSFSIINETLNNVKILIKKTIEVNRVTAPIDIYPFEDLPYTNFFTNNCDLHIFIITRPFDQKKNAQAAAIHHQKAGGTKRPITGSIFINPSKIPLISQNINSYPRDFFETLLHELCHILGISSSLFPDWIDINSDLPYSDFPSTIYEDPLYNNKKFSILHTPNSIQYAQERFSLTQSSSDIPIGIEFEMNNDKTKIDSHPSSRVYFSELMGSLFVGKRSISNLTFSILQDTGWYNINKLNAEPFHWGNGPSMLLSPLKNFYSKPPQISFPNHNLCWQNQSNNQCFYDYS